MVFRDGTGWCFWAKGISIKFLLLFPPELWISTQDPEPSLKNGIVKGRHSDYQSVTADVSIGLSKLGAFVLPT